jgi:hypothetical protein
MNVREAKDFLVNQTAEQGALDSVPLSGPRKTDDVLQRERRKLRESLALNEEFEAQYNSEEYEPKTARLLKHAYRRIKENPVQKGTCDQAVRELRNGDHYILVLWSISPPSEHPSRDFFAQIGIGVVIAFLIAIAIFVFGGR